MYGSILSGVLIVGLRRPGLWKVSLAQCEPRNPLPAAMASRKAFLPSFDIGGESSALFSAVRSPVV